MKKKDELNPESKTKGGVTMALLPLIRKDRSDLARLHRGMDNLFSSFFGDWPALIEQRLWPSVDISDNENELVVTAEVPGCKAEDIDISVQGDTLTISGEKKDSDEKREKGYYYRESSYGSFRRDINLPTDVQTQKVDASCKNGVLTVTLPKSEQAKSVRVKIKGQ